ncbi:MAG: hypothetical protein U0X39_02115 [Bacteroidales bacterium]
MKRLIILLVVLALAFSCKKVGKEPLGPTDIRIRNLSTSNMTSLKISTGAVNMNLAIYLEFQRPIISGSRKLTRKQTYMLL